VERRYLFILVQAPANHNLDKTQSVQRVVAWSTKIHLHLLHVDIVVRHRFRRRTEFNNLPTTQQPLRRVPKQYIDHTQQQRRVKVKLGSL
jgi:hypothetical protein